MTKQFHSIRSHTRPNKTVLEHTKLVKTIQDYDQILSRKINFFKRKDTKDEHKDYLLGIDSRLQEERHCHRRMTIQDIQFAVVLLRVIGD